jgi:hypothetical protein
MGLTSRHLREGDVVTAQWLRVRAGRAARGGGRRLSRVRRARECPDPEWELGITAKLERDVLRDLFPSYRSRTALTRPDAERFEAEIRKRKVDLWALEKQKYTAAGRASQEELRSLFRTFRAAFVETTLDPQWMALKARVLMSER